MRTDILHIFVLLNFAVSGPLLDRLAKRPVFLAHKSFPSIILLVLLLCVLLPTILAVCELVLGRWSRSARNGFHRVLVFLTLTALALPVSKEIRTLPGLATIGLSLFLGGFITWRYFCSPRWRSIVTLAAPGMILFPSVFLYYASVERTVLPNDTIPEVEVRNPVPVVVVSFDEFCGTTLLNANREIDAARYPNFAALAREGTWFRNATSVHPRTDHAIPAILTGNYPSSIRLPVASEYPQNLFTMLLATKKYELTVFEPFSKLFPSDRSEDFLTHDDLAQQLRSLLGTLSVVYLHHLLPNNIPFELPDIPRPWYGLRETWRVDRSQRSGVIRYSWDSDRDLQFDHFLDCLSRTEQPTLHFAHVVLPHYPWCYLPSGKQYREDGGANSSDAVVFGAYGPHKEIWGSDDLVIAHSYQRYLLQVGYVDRLLGRLVDRLKSVDLYDRCLLVIVADHGVSFRANHSRRSPVASNLADIMSIPLFIKPPHSDSGSISDRNVASIDLLPSIAEILGISLPFALDGTSVFNTDEPERSLKKFYNEGQLLTQPASFEARYATLQDMLGRFGTGADPAALFRVGPHSHLVGKSLNALKITGDSGIRVEIKHPQSFQWDPSETILPCYLEGEVAADVPDSRLPVSLAVAVNGTVQAVTRTYTLHDIKRVWTAMLPETAFQTGENALRVFVVSSEGEQLTLSACYP